MNYRHSYHAGNICDVVKHNIFLMILEYMQKKETGLAIMDTHAGCGFYALEDEAAQKTGEYETGLQKIWWGLQTAPPVLGPYMSCLKNLNPCDRLQKAPGSSYLAACALRPQDRLIACELHPEDVEKLRRNLGRSKGVQIHHRNGYEALKALVPFPEKRGLILIDPPFEQPDELEVMAQTLLYLHKCAPHYVVAAWYPIKERPALWAFHEKLAAADGHAFSVSEFVYRPETRHDRLNGTGYVFMNAPWVLKQQLEALYPALHALLETEAQEGVTLRNL